MKVGQILSAVTVVLFSLAGGLYTGLSGNEPLLGLDLQGGVSVVLQPVEGSETSDESLDQTLEIIRSRVDGLGVAEPEIARQDETILVNLPGAEEQQRAVDLIGQTAELRFRPVLADLPMSADGDPDTPGGPLPTALPETTTPQESSDSSGPETTAANGAEDDSGTTSLADPSDPKSEESSGAVGGLQQVAYQQIENPPTSGTPETTSGGDSDDTAESGGDDTGDDATSPDDDSGEAPTGEDIENQIAQQLGIPPECLADPALTEPEDDDPDEVVFFASEGGNLVCLGPSTLQGDALETADVGLGGSGGWTVNPTFNPGSPGIDQFNAAAFECNTRTPNCPTGRLAAVLDQKVVSSPTIQEPRFERSQVQISGDFTEEEAREVALQLRYGSLPIELETLQTDRVSGTLGDDVLRAGLISGLIGLAIVAVYLLFYYRLAGLVAILGLILSALLLWTIVAWLGESQGLALSLSGVVGIIVAIGVSADSNIVYFENVKDSYSQGRRVNTAIERAYEVAISTIVKADIVSLIAAGLLFWLTVGQVKGFALYLGLATFLDLIISMMFMRPALGLLARLPASKKNPRLLGLATPGGDR